MKRHHYVLLVVLAIQIGVAAVVFWPRQVETLGSQAFFPGLTADQIVSVTITNANGDSVTLQKEGGVWILPDAGNYPALVDKIDPLLEGIAGLTGGRLVTRTEGSHRRLQVADDEFVRRVDFETAEGSYTFYMGSSPSYGATHVRLGGEDETYVTDSLSTWDVVATVASWIDTLYWSVSQPEVSRITVENANGTLVFVNEADGNWVLEGLGADEPQNEEAVAATVRQATTINMLRPLGQEEQPEYGLDAPSAVVTLETASGEITLWVGAQDAEDESYVLFTSEADYYVQVANYSVRRLVEGVRDDYIQQPPTPTPQGAPD
ncbi:MAG: DUF4340 domain-containing protein [Anaerolineae bacterium]|nr:DUF4340 domain-containing protein [Anaerolineae bacterium]